MSTETAFQSIRQAGWLLPEQTWRSLAENDRQFALVEMAGPRTLDWYHQRLVHLGMTGLGRVLDAGCGMGQWAVAMSRVNTGVVGIDLNPRRLRVAEVLSKEMGGGNIQLAAGSLEQLPFRDAVFDAVFCYGALMFTRIPVTLREMCRVLKPGGRIYVNANAWGWYAHLFLDLGLRRLNFEMMEAAVRMVTRAFLGRDSRRLVTRRWLWRQLDKAGFAVLKASHEGGVSVLADTPPPAPGYPSRFYGLTSIVEFLAQKGARA